MTRLSTPSGSGPFRQASARPALLDVISPLSHFSLNEYTLDFRSEPSSVDVVLKRETRE